MRLIDAEVLAEGLSKRWHTADENAEIIISEVMANVVIPILAGTPTVDAVEVIRCAHCEHYFKHPLKFDSDEGHCVVNGKIKTDEDYCSRGKKFGGGH